MDEISQESTQKWFPTHKKHDIVVDVTNLESLVPLKDSLILGCLNGGLCVIDIDLGAISTFKESGKMS
jgi:hypothetical protein